MPAEAVFYIFALPLWALTAWRWTSPRLAGAVGGDVPVRGDGGEDAANLCSPTGPSATPRQ